MGITISKVNNRVSQRSIGPQKLTIHHKPVSAIDAHLHEFTAMKVKIRKWNAVATWRWDIPDDDVCGICQVHFDGTCPTCKYPGDDCSLLSGKCGHNFHMHCIVEWIKQESSKGQCPMCRQSMNPHWNCGKC